MSKTIGEKLTENRDALSALLTFANQKTGVVDVSLGDAVKTLADGFGGGSEIQSGVIVPDIDVSSVKIPAAFGNHGVLILYDSDIQSPLPVRNAAVWLLTRVVGCYLFGSTTDATNVTGRVYPSDFASAKIVVEDDGIRVAASASTVGYLRAGREYKWFAL